ncbi:MAG: hypothetical protein AAGK04_00935, partial [Planctomycetota bacterium]
MAHAQPEGLDAADVERASLEATLEELDSPSLSAAYLSRRLQNATGDDRTTIARRLADAYVEMLRNEQDSAKLEEIERRARELADGLPEIAAAPLRIDLLRARYARAQEAAERWRLRLATPVERRTAEAALAEIAGSLNDLGVRLHRRVEALEREERRGRTEDEALLREALYDARRQRSLAFYYAGWSNYYRSVLGRSPKMADDATRQLGWLLGGGGARPLVERTPKATFRFDHVARAAMGVALAEARRGEAVTAIRWLDAVESAEQVSDAIRDQLFTTRLVVLASGDRWADMVSRINVRRRETDQPLQASEARLLAVLALERQRDGVDTPGFEEILQTLAQVALADLVDAGQIGHVLDLVERFGAMPLGNEGFIVLYVRALRAYDEARSAHLAVVGEGERDAPAQQDDVALAYVRAAGLFRVAVDSDDAAGFASQSARASVLRGLSLYFSGDLASAADVLERAGGEANDSAAEEALWFAIVALDRAIKDGRPSLDVRLDRLALVYLERFPSGERAARLLLLRANAGLLEPEEAVDVLLAIAPSEPLYAAARREAGRLLYAFFRRSRGLERERVGARFIEVAESLIAFESTAARADSDESARDAAQRAILLTRQLLEVALSTQAPDLTLARRAIDELEGIAADAGVPLDGAAAELAYRRLQIAMLLQDQRQIERLVGELRQLDGPFSEAADRLLFQDALRRWRAASAEDGGATEQDIESARGVVRFGLRLVNRAGEMGTGAVIQEAVAAAAEAIYDAEQDETYLETARRLDGPRIRAGLGTESALRRHARLSEGAGDIESALDAWRRLLAALPSQTAAWYEARVESLRLLA